MSPDDVGKKIEWQEAESGCARAYTRDGREVFLHAPYQSRGWWVKVKIVVISGVSEIAGEPVWRRIQFYHCEVGLYLETEEEVLEAVRRE